MPFIQANNGYSTDFTDTLRQLADGNESKLSFCSLRLVINTPDWAIDMILIKNVPRGTLPIKLS